MYASLCCKARNTAKQCAIECNHRHAGIGTLETTLINNGEGGGERQKIVKTSST